MNTVRHARSRAIVLTAALLVASGCSAEGSPAPDASADSAAACHAQPPLLPFLRPDMDQLQGLRGALREEAGRRAPELNGLYVDESAMVVVLEVRHPSKILCDDIHARFGPFVEIVHGEPGQLAYAAPGGLLT
jgi:hypothetical protein